MTLSSPNAMLPNPSFWQGKRVLLTGHSGFKGSWLALWLHQLGAKVTGVALAPDTKPSLFEALGLADLIDSHWVDINDAAKIDALFQRTQPQVVLHLAAQPLVRKSYQTPIETFATNVMGTAHVLQSCRAVASVKSIVAITTDKVYENHEDGSAYAEGDHLGGHDPYSASKAACEIVIDSYRKSFFNAAGVCLHSARAGNVIGGGDWSADRIIPDAVRSWQSGQALSVRMPQAVRPWQHVIEPLAAYLKLAEDAWQRSESGQSGEAWNIGPNKADAAPVRTVIDLARSVFADASTACEVAWGDINTGPHEAGLLMLDNTKAKTQLGIQPVWGLATAVERTLQWYKAFNANHQAAQQLCLADLKAFELAASTMREDKA